MVGSSGFACDWLEDAYCKWRRRAVLPATRAVLWIVAVASACRALAYAPEISVLKPGAVSSAALLLQIFIAVWPDRAQLAQWATAMVLIADAVLNMPGINALFPTILCVFCIYSLLLFNLYVTLALTVCISVAQTGVSLLFEEQLRINELLAVILVHVWTHSIGLYLRTQGDRLSRSSFLSGRNSVEAELSAEFQSNRLNQLLSAFLPQHLITTARHQIALYNPHIYAEHYPQVTVVYGRLIGFEAILSQCSSLDAARVIKELDSRIDRLCVHYGCTRVLSEGILAVASIPLVDSEHAVKICKFALELECLVNSFRESTSADVACCIGVDSGSISAGIIGSSKWHYDVIGSTVDNAVLLQSNAPGHGVFITEETRRLLTPEFLMDNVGDCWKLTPIQNGTQLFPVNKRYSLVTVPQAINRLLQTVGTPTLKINNGTKKRPVSKVEPAEASDFDPKKLKGSFMNTKTLTFKNSHMEGMYHKEMDHWFIPAIGISLFFLVVYGIYHMLVMPRLLTSLVLVFIAFCAFFVILLMLYINYFQSFSQFITRTSAGHTITVIILLLVLFLCGIVNTFSCPSTGQSDVCRLVHFSALSFGLWILTASVFLRFSAVNMLFSLAFAIAVYGIQIFLNHPPIGPKQFGVEFDLICYMIALAAMVFYHSRKSEKLMRLDFLAVVKGVEECSSKDNLLLLNSQVLLNLVPPHVAPWIANKGAELWHHAHHSVGVAYLAVSGFELQGEEGMNGLNFVFSYFDQALANYRGIEKIKNSNRFYIVAVGMLPDAAQNVNETPWTIGELLNTLAQFLIHVTKFAEEKEFHVQIGLDCGSAITIVPDALAPKYDLWGDTVERSRILMQSASQGRILVSEEIYLALRPRPLHFGAKSFKVMSNMNAYVLYCNEDDDDEKTAATMGKEEQKRHTQLMVENAKDEEMASSMASSFSSELHTIDDDAETDSDIEWITPESALMNSSITSSTKGAGGPLLPFRNNYREVNGYDPYREPVRMNDYYKAEQAVQYSDWDLEPSRAASRTSNYSRNRWRAASKTSLKNPFGWLKKASSMEVDSLADPHERLEAAATRVDRMIQELNAYGDFAEVRPLEYRPFPTAFGSVKSVHRAMSSACHTEYDNAESDAALSDVETNNTSFARNRERRRTKWKRDGTDADTESQCSSVASSMNPLRWKSVHSVGYENEYEMVSDNEGLAIEEMKALSRDIRRNFGDFKLATFDDIDQD